MALPRGLFDCYEFMHLMDFVVTQKHKPETSALKVVSAWPNHDVFFRLQKSPSVSDGSRPKFSINIWAAPSASASSSRDAAAKTTVATWNIPGITETDFPTKFDAVCKTFKPDVFAVMDVHFVFQEWSEFFKERGYVASTIVPGGDADTGDIWVIWKPESVSFVTSAVPTIEAIDASIER